MLHVQEANALRLCAAFIAVTGLALRRQSAARRAMLSDADDYRQAAERLDHGEGREALPTDSFRQVLDLIR